MTFVRKGKYWQQSEDRQYTVCWVSGRYEAWHLQEQIAVNLETAEKARETCLAHQRSQQKIASHAASERMEEQA